MIPHDALRPLVRTTACVHHMCWSTINHDVYVCTPRATSARARRHPHPLSDPGQAIIYCEPCVQHSTATHGCRGYNARNNLRASEGTIGCTLCPTTDVRCVRLERSPNMQMQITDGAKEMRACVRGEGGAPRRGGLHCPPSVALCDGASESRERSRERGPVGIPDLSVFGETCHHVPIVPIVVPVPVPECPVPVPEVPVPVAQCPVPVVPSRVPVPIPVYGERATIASPAAAQKQDS